MKDVSVTFTGEEARAVLDALRGYNDNLWLPPGIDPEGDTLDAFRKLHAAVYGVLAA